MSLEKSAALAGETNNPALSSSYNMAANLVYIPGFEAGQADISAIFKRMGSGYSIDNDQKHCGSRSMRLQTDATNKEQGMTCVISGSAIKTPGQIIISGWSKAQNVSGNRDGNYALYVDVCFADGSNNVYGKTASFGTGTHDWEYGAVTVKVDKAVKDISVSALLRGNHAGTAWFDDIFVGNYVESMERYNGDSFCYALPDKVTQISRRMAALKERMSVLAEMLDKAAQQNIDVINQRISLTVAEVFAGYVTDDAERSPETYRRLKLSDFTLLGQEEASGRIEKLPEFEMRECARIVENAILELKATHTLRNSGYHRRDTSYRASVRVNIQNGCFTLNGSPTFFYGMYFAPPAIMKVLGANLDGYLNMCCSRMNQCDKFDDDSMAANIKLRYQSAQTNGLFVPPLFYPTGMPKWLTDATPGLLVNMPKWLTDATAILLVEKYWFRPLFAFDIDHPVVERYVTSVCARAAALAKDFPNNFCYNIMGEERCHPEFRGPATERRYADWLGRRFGGKINRLNSAFGKSYKDFNEAACDKDLTSKGQLYCWYSFNQFRLTQFNRWCIDGIRQGDPSPQSRYYAYWPTIGCLVGQPVGGWHPKMGINLEDVVRQGSVSGWDGGMIPYEALETERRWSQERKKYNVAWRNQLSYYDFAKSVAPNQPIFDPEWHTITSVNHISPLGISPDFIRMTLWLEHLHGLGAHILWWWGRNADGTPQEREEFSGGMLAQPQLLDGWARTMQELQRLSEYITLFPVLERKVRILYSEPSAIVDGQGYSDVLRVTYESLYFLDYPAGFITEKMIVEEELKNCALLVVPNARYVGNEAVAGVKRFVENGGIVAVIGKENFRYDEYGQERAVDFNGRMTPLSGATASEWSIQLDDLMEKAGVERPVRILDAEGNPIEGLEMRMAQKGQSRVIYLVNLRQSSVALVLRQKDKKGKRKARDLINDSEIDLNETILMRPRDIILLEVE
ncbi:MAG: beta-galactosidase trimerization domain-containing protein [Kiritimatiellaeota bacterium]|nr:beta-galactosidase trimerization domain-containing protein [Kiritimatiellota bacterium]